MKKIVLFFVFSSFFLMHLGFSLEKFHAITVANKWNQGISLLKRSAIRNGFDIEVLGLGESWEGNGKKFLILREYIKDLPDTDIIFFVDAYDVFILAHKEKFLEAFKAKGTPILCSAERNLFPVTVIGHLKEGYPTSDTSFRFLNSGAYIGYVGALKRMLEGIDEFKRYITDSNLPFSDQAYMHSFFVDHQDMISLDKNAELFLNLYEVLLMDLKYDAINKRIYVKETKTCPLLIHGNGCLGKEIYLKIINFFYYNKNILDVPLETFNYKPSL